MGWYNSFHQHHTAWNVSKYGVISGPYFPVFSPNTGKYGPEITPYLDTFHSVPVALYELCKKTRKRSSNNINLYINVEIISVVVKLFFFKVTSTVPWVKDLILWINNAQQLCQQMNDKIAIFSALLPDENAVWTAHG